VLKVVGSNPAIPTPIKKAPLVEAGLFVFLKYSFSIAESTKD
jgi:hypothetical protein